MWGDSIDLNYTPLLSGVKEDIVLHEYIPNAEFSFSFYAEGLSLYERDGEYFFAKERDSADGFQIGNVIAYDQNNNLCNGEIRISRDESRIAGNYILTISVSDEFLSDPDLVYPVIIDPTIKVNCGSINGVKYIADAPVFSGAPTQNFGNYIYNSIGATGTSFKTGKTCVKLMGFIGYSAYSTISEGQIIDVEFYVRDSSGSSASYINLYPLTNSSWTESNVTWNSVASYFDSNINCGNIMANNGWTAFNITALAKKWKNGTLSSNAGFILNNINESNLKAFYSSENSSTANRPYVWMKYTTSSVTMPNENAQNKENWCWAAASKKVGVHNGGGGALPTGTHKLTYTDKLHSYNSIEYCGSNSAGERTADAGQRYIVYTISGTDKDTSGTTSYKEQALQLASSATMTIGTKYNPATTDLAFMKAELNAGRWIVASTIPIGDVNAIGHSVVLNYYNQNYSLYGYWDPWCDSNYYFFESSLLSDTIKSLHDKKDHKLRFYHYCK